MRWLTTTDHQDIGTLYPSFSLFTFFVGGITMPGGARRTVQVRECDMDKTFSDIDLERRRAAARRFARPLGAAVLAIYLIGLFIKR